MKRFQSLAVCFIAFAMLIPPAETFAQRFRIFNNGNNNCPNGQCLTPQITYGAPIYQAPVIQQPQVPCEPVQTAAATAAEWYSILVGPNGRTLTDEEKKLAYEWSKRAVRVYQGNGCGTGNLVGRDDKFIYIMTNAHVASTKIGSVSKCQAFVDGKVQTFNASAVESAYSNYTRTDWTLLKADATNMAGIEPIKMSKEKPDANKITTTWGCPRCEPIRGQVLQTVSMGQVWYWLPNSIGGQSGSAVVQEGHQVGLLTWTENGKGSGQFTASIWAQAKNQNTDGPARTGAEVPVSNPLGVELREGFHTGDRETGLGEYPIWEDGSVTPPPGPVDPNCPEDDDTVKRFKGLRDRLKERGYDWIAILNLIMQLIELFSKKTTAMDFPSLSADFGSSPVMFVNSSPGRSLAA